MFFAREMVIRRGGGVFFTLARRSTFDVRRARDGRRTRESRAVSRSRRAVRGVSRRVPPRVSLLQTRIRRVVRVAVSLGETRARRGAALLPRRDPRPDRARGGDETRGRVTRRSDAKERIVGDDAVRPGDGLPVVVRRGPPVRRGGGLADRVACANGESFGDASEDEKTEDVGASGNDEEDERDRREGSARNPGTRTRDDHRRDPEEEEEEPRVLRGVRAARVLEYYTKVQVLVRYE